MFQKLARAWGFSEAGAKGSSHVNHSAVALWHFGVATFLLATDQEISAHP